MKQYHGLETCLNSSEQPSDQHLAACLLDDLKDCYCEIYGEDKEQAILLTRLALVEETLHYDRFDKRIDFTVNGEILRDDYLPLTYRLQGRQFAITGRCSMIGKVCGVDLYLSKSYSGRQGDFTQQRFKIKLKDLRKVGRYSSFFAKS